MAQIASYLWSTFNSAIFGPPPPVSEPEDPTSSFYDSSRYAPFVRDVLSVKELLFWNKKLPIELIDTIIDFAEYWPRTTTSQSGREINVRAGRPNVEDQFMLRSYPLGYVPGVETLRNDKYPILQPRPWLNPDNLIEGLTGETEKRWIKHSQIRGEFPCRKIVFRLSSHDQGWGGDRSHKGTYRGSFTWFDVGKERIHTFENEKAAQSAFEIDAHRSENNKSYPVILYHNQNGIPQNTLETISPTVHSSTGAFEHPLLPTTSTLQKNLTATRDYQERTITWSCRDDVDADSVDGKALEDQGRGRATADGRYVREMKVGDVVTLWAKARFPGWIHTVERVEIDVYWAV